MAFVIILVLLVVVLWLMSQKSKPTEMPAGYKTTPDFQWRDPVSAKEHLVLFAAMGEVVSAYDRPWVSLSVLWNYGPGKDDTIELSYSFADDLSVYGGTAPGRYMKGLMDSRNVAIRSFRFPTSNGGAPRCFRSGDDVLDVIRSFAPHAYVESDSSASCATGGLIIIRFRQHKLDDLPAEYYIRGMDSNESFERLIVRHYNL